MFGKRLLSTLFVAASVTSCTPVPEPQGTASAEIGSIKAACAGRDGWSDPAPPAHVYGNVYMVGTCGIVSLLITTPKGHFLIDGATQEAAKDIAGNIRELGFNPKDVRYLVASHEHVDHAGGLAELKRITGAKFVTRAEAQAAMESGAPDRSDPQLGLLPPFEGVKSDLILRDGGSLRLGRQELTMIATPGHTPGGTSWTWKSCEGRQCRHIVYSDSLNAVSADAYRFTDHPEYVATLRATIARIATLEKCDILISPHPAQSQFFDRLADKTKLVDAAGCRHYAAAANERLDARLAKESAR